MDKNFTIYSFIDILRTIISGIFDLAVLISATFFIAWIILMYFMPGNESTYVIAFFIMILTSFFLTGRMAKKSKNIQFLQLVIKNIGSIIFIILFLVISLFKENFLAKSLLPSLSKLENTLNMLVISSIGSFLFIILGIAAIFFIAYMFEYFIKLFPRYKILFILMAVIVLVFMIYYFFFDERLLSLYFDLTLSNFYWLFGFSLFPLHLFYLLNQVKNLIYAKTGF